MSLTEISKTQYYVPKIFHLSYLPKAALPEVLCFNFFLH